MIKKALIFIIILFTLLSLYFIYNYFIRQVTKTPTIREDALSPKTPTSADFQGPAGPPSTKGPTGPPPIQ